MGKKRRTVSAALAGLALTLGAAGCGAEDEAAKTPPPPPRPAGTGPLTKDVVRADVDGAVAAAGLPRNAEDYGQLADKGSGRLPAACSLAFKSFDEESTPVDLSRYDTVVGALRDRAWQPAGERKERKARDGTVGVAEQLFEQRGWFMVTEYREAADGQGVVTLRAHDIACVKKSGILDQDPTAG
ncbi:hypothetical protein [Streptomyces roseoviridis]|uniref:Lipoprotein n=1 Tax=Streptomyces roseoviridis TaxID=67361 RepID=A0ABV5QN83_9ACTN